MLDPLLQPFQLKHLTLRNRILSTAHAPSFAEQGHPRDRYRLYHEEKAKGGVALTMIGGSTNIAPDSPSVFGQLYAGDDSILPWFQALTKGVKEQGAAVMCQLTHMGRRTAWDDAYWLPVIGPSGVREQAHRAYPKAMESYDIQRVINDFAQAALRCKQSGFDGIEILAHSHLLGQFMSPLINQRTDDYGGSTENRLRLSLQVLDAIRSVVGPDYIVGMRITGDEEIEGGLCAQECIDIAKRLEQSGMVDFFNILMGAPYDDLGLAGWVPPMGLPSAQHLDAVGEMHRHITLPVFHAGGIADVATARYAVNNGFVDMVGMTRAQMADPYLVSKLQSGNETRIRPCVGLGYCVDRVNQGKDAVCGHNAATGREGQLPHIIATTQKTQKVVVVGGGPAGLEAARVCAERGHNVVLFEANSRLGGQLCLADKGQTRKQIWGIADWLINEVEHLGVDIRLNTFADVDDIQQENPNVVLIATGGYPSALEIEGTDLLISSWDILSGNMSVSVSGSVLLWDETGKHAAAVTADYLASMGAQVQFVTPDSTPLTELGPTTHSVAMRDLYQANVSFLADRDLMVVQRNINGLVATLRNVLTGQVEQHEVNHVVVEIATQPMDELYYGLISRSQNYGEIDYPKLINGQYCFPKYSADASYLLARIGDAVASRNIHAAVYDALRIGLTI